MPPFLKSKFTIAAMIFVAVELLVFRSGFYNALASPYSFAGMLVERTDLAKAKRNNDCIALLGDSRLREGFSAKIFDQVANSPSAPKALNLGLSGSDPRVWYYLLKDVDPDCHSFKMLVFALPSYFDEDYIGTSNKREDLQLLLPILRIGDVMEFTKSYQDQSITGDLLTALWWKMYGFRQDLRDLLAHPLQRFRDCVFFRDHWFETDYQYTGNTASLAGARIVGNQIVGLPSFVSHYHKERLELTMLGLSEMIHKSEFPYLQYWLAKLTARYANTPTKLVFVRIPAYPFPPPAQRHVHANGIKAMSTIPNVIIDPNDAYSSLERPEYFFDDVHLNNVGRKIFSERLSLALIKYAKSDSSAVAAEGNKPAPL